jgi:hypothetical protein
MNGMTGMTKRTESQNDRKLYLSEAGSCEHHEVEDGHVVDPLEVVLGQAPVLQVRHPDHQQTAF